MLVPKAGLAGAGEAAPKLKPPCEGVGVEKDGCGKAVVLLSVVGVPKPPNAGVDSAVVAAVALEFPEKLNVGFGRDDFVVAEAGAPNAGAAILPNPPVLCATAPSNPPEAKVGADVVCANKVEDFDCIG